MIISPLLLSLQHTTTNGGLFFAGLKMRLTRFHWSITTDIHNERQKMLPENRIPTHPGVILLQEFLQPMELTQVAFAKHIGVPIQRINEIVKGKRGVTPETAWLFAQAFGTTPQFWLNLQANHDLARNRPDKAVGKLKAAS